jgi:hypothetical protein
VRAQAGAGLRPIPQATVDRIRAQTSVVTCGAGMDRPVWPGLLRRLDRQLPGYAD